MALSLADWLPEEPKDKRLANVRTQRAAYLSIRAYARQPIGWRLVPHWKNGVIGVRAIKNLDADCSDKATRLELIRLVHRRIKRLREIFRLLREAKEEENK